MSFSKVIELGSVGSVSVAEAAGVLTVSISAGASLGGGQAAGVAKVKASAEVDLSAEQAFDLLCAVAEAKFPALAAVIKGAQDAGDAVLSKA